MLDDEYDCWNPGSVFVIDGTKSEVVLLIERMKETDLPVAWLT